MSGGNADVVYERVEPNISHVIGIERHRDTPIQPVERASNTKVFQDVMLEKAQNFVAPVIRCDKRRIILDVINQPLLVIFEFEIVILLLQLDHFSVCRIECPIGTAVAIGQKGFFLGGIESLVNLFVEVTFGMKFGQNSLHDFFMARFGRADEVIIGQLERGRKLLPNRGQFIAISLWGLALGHRRLLDFLAVLVQAGQKKRLLPEAAPGPRNHIRHNHLVRVAQVRLAIDVVNGCRDVKALAHRRYFGERRLPWQLLARGQSECQEKRPPLPSPRGKKQPQQTRRTPHP